MLNRRHVLKATTTAATGFPIAPFLEASAPPGARAHAVFSLPDLGYSYDALEPHIDTATMALHHKHHHQDFVRILNAQVDKWPELAAKPLSATLSNLFTVPDFVRLLVRNAGGGHWNHTFFWDLMTPGGATAPSGDLEDAIVGTFGSVETMQAAVIQAGLSRFGSGWAWLVLDKTKKLAVVHTPFQDTPHMDLDAEPILGVDVWEHAYYLKHQHRRHDYLVAWWNTVNWDKAAANFRAATKAPGGMISDAVQRKAPARTTGAQSP